MKKVHLFFLSILFFSACKEDTPAPNVYDVPSVFQPYIDRFVQEANKRGMNISIDNLKVEFESDLDGGEAAGTCSYTDPPHIRIDSTTQSWKSNEARREMLMFHELGHCILNRREHRDDKMTNGNFASIMRAINFQLYGEHLNAHKRDFYLDELFNPGVNFPDWAQDAPTYNSVPSSSKRATFVDNFDDNRNRWQTGDGSNATLSISGGTYKIFTKGSGSLITTRNVPLNSSNDFEIEVRFRTLEEDKLVLLLWGGSKTSNSDHYFFGNASQNVYLGWRESGTSAFHEIAWVNNDFNTFTIRKQGENYYFYINEQLADNGKFETFFGNDFGFIVGSSTSLEVDFFNVYEID